MIIDRMTRRAVLQGAGKAALTLPVLPSLLSAKDQRLARAQNNLRFLAIHSPRGRIMNQWFPDPAKFSQRSDRSEYRIYDFANYEGEISPILRDQTFQSLRMKLMLIRGLDYVHGRPSGTHYAPFMLNSYYQVASQRQGDERFLETIDQKIAHAPATYSTEPLLRSLHLAAMANPGDPEVDELQTLSIRMTRTQGPVDLIPSVNPHGVFRQLFMPEGEQHFTHEQKLRVVDAVIEDYQTIKRMKKLSSADLEKMEAHVAALRDLEVRLQAIQPKVCMTKPSAPSIASKDRYLIEDLPLLMDCHMRLIMAAFSCGLTKVATLMLEAGDHVLPFTGVTGRTHHAISHLMGEPWVGQKFTIDFWYATKVAQFLQMLDDARSDEGSMLDQTLVYWGSEFSDGKNHSRYNMPVLLAGATNSLNCGKFIDYQQDVPPPPHPGVYKEPVGRPYNEFLIGIMLAMGLSPADWESVGEEGYGYYRENIHRRVYDLSNKRAPSPGMLKTRF